jgi:hypothetical protein
MLRPRRTRTGGRAARNSPGFSSRMAEPAVSSSTPAFANGGIFLRACEEIECRVRRRSAAVIPAKAGIHFSLWNKRLDRSPHARIGVNITSRPSSPRRRGPMVTICHHGLFGLPWIPAFAGMTPKRWQLSVILTRMRMRGDDGLALHLARHSFFAEFFTRSCTGKTAAAKQRARFPLAVQLRTGHRHGSRPIRPRSHRNKKFILLWQSLPVLSRCCG